MNRYVVVITAIFFLLGLTAPIHIPPWTAFYNEWPFVVALFILAIFVVFKNNNICFPFGFLIPFLLTAIPLIQYFSGRIYFIGDVVMPVFYLSLLGVAFIVGYNLKKNFKDGSIVIFAILFLCGGLISVIFAAQQWLRVDLLGVWVTDIPVGGRSYANIAQPNNLATLLFIGLLSLLYLYERGQVRRIIFWSAVILLISGVAMTRSKTGLVLGFFVFAWVALWRKKLTLKISLIENIGLFIFVWLLWLYWPEISATFTAEPAESLRREYGDNLRLAIWEELFGAVFLKPWFGWGWNQISVAQYHVASDYQESVLVEHSHNIILDLLLWNGVLIGGAIVLYLAWWLVSRGLKLHSVASWFAFSVVGVVLVHAMLELPLEYSYFLIPFGCCVGFVEFEFFSKRLLIIGRKVFGVMVCGLSIIGGVIFIDYINVESSYRNMRFYVSGIGSHEGLQNESNILLFSQYREYITFAKTQAKKNLTAVQLQNMQRVVERFPFPAPLMRYAVALVLNGHPAEAVNQMKILKKLNKPDIYTEAKNMLFLKSEGNKEFLIVLEKMP